MPPEFLALGDDAAQHLQFGCCLLRVRGTYVLDTACGTLPHSLVDTLRDDFGVSPDDVRVVVHTHLHADHIGNNVYADGTDRPAFPNASLRASRRVGVGEFTTGSACLARQRPAQVCAAVARHGAPVGRGRHRRRRVPR